MNLRIHLIPAGETAVGGDRFAGLIDEAITAKAEEQARMLGTRLPKNRFARVLISPRLAARRTAERMGLAPVIEVDPDLAEWAYGDYENLNLREIHARRAGWDLFRDGCPGGETPVDAGARADRVIARLRTLSGTVAIFSHRDFGCVLGARWIGLEVAAAARLRLDPGSLSVLETHSAARPGAVIALWNGTAAHLEETQVPLGDTRSMKERALERWENEGGELRP